MNRRAFLKGTGAVAVLVVAGGAWRAYDQGVFSVGEGPAYEPWTNWRPEADDGPLALVRAAILAANPHNTQPWLFKVSPSLIELYADTSRNLGAFDPYFREMYLGLGCALENMMLAAPANGYTAEARLASGTLRRRSSRKGPTLVATLALTATKPRVDGLYRAIPNRQTHRGAYKPQPLTQDTFAAMSNIVSGDSDVKLFTYPSAAEKAKFGATVISATDAIVADSEMLHDSEKWFRHSWDRIQTLRDGVTLDAAGVPPAIAAVAKTLPASSPEKNHGHWRDATANVHVATAQMFGLIAVRDRYDIEQTLRAGRLWQRLHLWATNQGLAMQPLNQAIEMVDRELEQNKRPAWDKTLEELTGAPSWQSTFAFRAGYAYEAARLSPRRAAESVLI
jgi:hypothetical protein